MPISKPWRFAAVGALVFATASCRPEPMPEPESGAEGSGSEARPAGALVVYSGRSQSLVGGMIDAFEIATGLEVAVRWGESGELAATLLEEGSSTAADVFLAQDPGALGAVESMFAPLPDSILGRVPDDLRPTDSLWVPITGRARVVVYNTDTVPEASLPAGIDGFTDPVWKGRVGWAPTNASFQAMVTSMRVLWGEDRTRSWLTGMLDNDVVVYDSNAPIVAAVGTGEIGIGLVNHYYLYRFVKEEGAGFKARNHFMHDRGPGSLVLVSGAGILKNAAHRDAAERFVSYMLSAATQKRFADETHEYPVAVDVAAPADLPPLADLNGPEIAVADLADLVGTVALLRDVGALP